VSAFFTVLTFLAFATIPAVLTFALVTFAPAALAFAPVLAFSLITVAVAAFAFAPMLSLALAGSLGELTVAVLRDLLCRGFTRRIGVT